MNPSMVCKTNTEKRLNWPYSSCFILSFDMVKMNRAKLNISLIELSFLNYDLGKYGLSGTKHAWPQFVSACFIYKPSLLKIAR